MIEKPIKTCSKDTCKNCDINLKTNCNFNFRQLIQFYLIVLPSFIIGGIQIYNYDSRYMVVWLVIIVFFLL